MVNKLLNWQLKDRMKLKLVDKISLSKLKIQQFIEYFDDCVYVAFSGGIDSLVLLHLVRCLRPGTMAVRVIEPSYKELNVFVKNVDNVVELRPDLSYDKIIEKYGYPVVSKEVSKNISRYRKGNDDVKKYRMYGIKKDGSKGKYGVIPKKWHYLVNAPFKISDKCCDIIKKNPFKRFEKRNNLKPFIGIKAVDSQRRKDNYLKTGCNVYSGSIKSTPIAFWSKKDVWNYIKMYKINYCSLYDKGEKNLGCIYCLFGIHLETIPNRIQRMYWINEQLYNYGINKLNLKLVLNHLKIDYKPINKLDKWW